MTKKYVLDTNTLLQNPEIIEKYDSVILSDVIRELEKHKLSHNKELVYNARKATRYINQNFNKVTFDFVDYEVTDEKFNPNHVDNRIITACKQNDYGLITFDILLKFKAKGEGIEVIDLDNISELNSLNKNYTGIHKIYLSESSPEDQKLLASIYENNFQDKFRLLHNQYLIIYNKDKWYFVDGKKHFEVIDRFRFNGEKLIKLKLPDKKYVKPKNEEQECALDLLYSKDIPIKIIAGCAGSGKTFLTVKSSLYHVIEKGNYAKIMVIRNPIGSGESIGWLKGTKQDKTQDFFKPFIQHLEGGEQEAEILESRGQLIKEIPYYIKGLSIDETFVMVDEAEDLDVKLLRLIGTRLGENSVITFTGDYKQSEDKFMINNGLLHAIDSLKGNPLVGIVILSEDVRSKASKVFAEMKIN